MLTIDTLHPCSLTACIRFAGSLLPNADRRQPTFITGHIMLKKFALHSAAIAALSSPSFATVIANWTFDTLVVSPTAPGAGIPSQSIPADGGVNAAGAAALGFHAGASTYSSPIGNGSAKSLSSNTWVPATDYYQFAVSTVGFSPIFVSFSETSSGTGPRDFVLEYSSTGTGGPFTLGPTYSVPANAGANTA